MKFTVATSKTGLMVLCHLKCNHISMARLADQNSNYWSGKIEWMTKGNRKEMYGTKGHTQ